MPPSVTHEAALAFGHAVRVHRRAQHVTMAAAAEAAGMSRLTWRRIEIGEANIAWRFVLAAADSIGLDVRAVPKPYGVTGNDSAPGLNGDWLPLKIRPNEFLGLQRLGWQAGVQRQVLTPREAWELYDRNGRHLDRGQLTAPESALIAALERVYGALDVNL